jgi:hypothetical protein
MRFQRDRQRAGEWSGRCQSDKCTHALTDRASGSKGHSGRPRWTTLRTIQPHSLETQPSFLTPIFEAEVRAEAAGCILLCWE